MAGEAITYRQLSDEPDRWGWPDDGLEPRRQGLRFLGPARNWLGLMMMGTGALLIILSSIA